MNNSFKVQKYDGSISVLRIIAMIFIILCHIASHEGNNIFAQFFNVGVHLFFLISGYLYGERDFHGSLIWFVKRMIRLYMPILAWTIVVTVVSIVRQYSLPTWYQYIFLLFDLQGINFIFYTIPDVFVGPWFFTSIMFCYLALWAYTSIPETNFLKSLLVKRGGIFSYLFFVILAMVGISTDGLLIFLIGYVLAKKRYLENNSNYKRKVLISIFVFITACIVRILSHRMFDGTRMYMEVIAPTCHIGIACSILIFVKMISNKYKAPFCRFADLRVIKYLDKTSIYTYISHDWYIGGMIFSIIDAELSLGIKIMIFSVAVIVTSGILYAVFDRIGCSLLRIVSHSIRGRYL